MTTKFFLFCLAISISVSLFFLNMTISSVARDFTLSDIILGKILNQSNTILLLGYILINFWKSLNTKIYWLMAIFCVEIFSELLFFVLPNDGRWIFEDILIITERVFYGYIFILLGSRILANNLRNNLLNLLLGLLLLAFYFWGIKASETPLILFYFVFLAAIFMFFVLGINAKNNISHPISYGVAFILLSDLMFIYSQYHNVFYQYLYLLPRISSCLGELLITYEVLKNAKTLPRKVSSNVSTN